MSFFKDLLLLGKASGTIEGLEKQISNLEITLLTSKAKQTQLTTEVISLRSRLKLTVKKNEELLSQLLLVQEELERYYLKCKELKSENQRKQMLIDLAIEKNLDPFLFHSIECARDIYYPERYRWIITSLSNARMSWRRLEFLTFIEGDIAGIIFEQDDENNSSLSHWPEDFKDCDELECIPSGNIENAETRANILKALSSSDWCLLTIIPEILAKAIKLKQVKIDEEQTYVHSLIRTREILVNHIPRRCRFDKVRILNELIHPGYEHLSIELINFMVDEVFYPKFEFRLGCSRVTKRRFGTHPRLEFPLSDEKPPFGSWYPESQDEFGEKLELRFATPNSMDLEVWQKLSAKDQQLVGGLIYSLSRIIKMALAGQIIKRTPDDWINVADEMSLIFKRLFPNISA